MMRSCLILACRAPRSEAGIAWERWVRPEQLDEWNTLATGDPSSLVADFAESVGFFARMTPRRLQGLGGAPDPRSIAQHNDVEMAPFLARSMRRAVLTGYFGFLDDNLAQARSWGVDVAGIRVPVVGRH